MQSSTSSQKIHSTHSVMQGIFRSCPLIGTLSFCICNVLKTILLGVDPPDSSTSTQPPTQYLAYSKHSSLSFIIISCWAATGVQSIRQTLPDCQLDKTHPCQLHRSLPHHKKESACCGLSIWDTLSKGFAFLVKREAHHQQLLRGSSCIWRCGDPCYAQRQPWASPQGWLGDPSATWNHQGQRKWRCGNPCWWNPSSPFP